MFHGQLEGEVKKEHFNDFYENFKFFQIRNDINCMLPKVFPTYSLNRTCPVEKAVHRIANTDACNRCRLECDERIGAKLPFSCVALLCRYTSQNVPTYISLMND